MFINNLRYTDKNYKEFIALDCETTGLKPDVNKIIEIAAIKYKNGDIIDTFHTLINPQEHIPYYITKINGIKDDMVKDKPTIEEVMPKLMEFIGELPIVAHNASFDAKFLKYTTYRLFGKDLINNYFIDTVKIARMIYPNLPNHKLETIKNYLGLNLKSHRAFDDTIVAANIYLNYCNR